MDTDNSTQETVLFRRLYFLFPDIVYTRQAVAELKGMGLNEKDMHTVANRKIDISDLPEAKNMLKQDRGGFVEDLFWMVNLTVFFSALTLLLSDLFQGLSALTIVPLVMIAVCSYLGSKMSGVPNINVEDFKFAIRRGEVLLMVDMSEEKIEEVENKMQAAHPEVIIGGVGAAIDSNRF